MDGLSRNFRINHEHKKNVSRILGCFINCNFNPINIMNAKVSVRGWVHACVCVCVLISYVKIDAPLE